MELWCQGTESGGVLWACVVGVGDSGGEAVQGVDRLKRLEVGLVHDSLQVLGDGGFLVLNGEGAARVWAVKYYRCSSWWQ